MWSTGVACVASVSSERKAIFRFMAAREIGLYLRSPYFSLGQKPENCFLLAGNACYAGCYRSCTKYSSPFLKLIPHKIKVVSTAINAENFCDQDFFARGGEGMICPTFNPNLSDQGCLAGPCQTSPSSGSRGWAQCKVGERVVFGQRKRDLFVFRHFQS